MVKSLPSSVLSGSNPSQGHLFCGILLILAHVLDRERSGDLDRHLKLISKTTNQIPIAQLFLLANI